MKSPKQSVVTIIAKAIGFMKPGSGLYLTCIFGYCLVDLAQTVLFTIGMRNSVNAFIHLDFELFRNAVMLIFIGKGMDWVYAPCAAYLTARVSKKTLRDIRIETIDHIVRLPMKTHDTVSKGTWLSLLTNDIACLEGLYDRSFCVFLSNACTGIGSVLLMAWIDWRFAFCVLALGALSIYISVSFGKRIGSVSDALHRQYALSNARLYEVIKAAKSIRLLGIQPHKQTQIEEDLQREMDAKIEGGEVMAKMNAYTSATNALSYVAILFIGALFVHFGLSDWGNIVALMAVRGTADWLFVYFGENMANVQMAASGIKRYMEAEKLPEESERLEHIGFRDTDCPLSVHNLSFAYSGPVLEDFSMRLEAKGITALVGESGSGKSTVMKLLLGLYEPQSGEIVFCGRGSGTRENVRSMTAYVPQEPMLLRGSFRENILYGNPEASDDDVRRAAVRSGADGFIRQTKDGYDTVITDDGSNISGGQKQRIAIARALVKGARVLLLDEVTASLDDETAEELMDTIEEIAESIPVLFITHKAGVIARANCVYRLDRLSP